MREVLCLLKLWLLFLAILSTKSQLFSDLVLEPLPPQDQLKGARLYLGAST